MFASYVTGADCASVCQILPLTVIGRGGGVTFLFLRQLQGRYTNTPFVGSYKLKGVFSYFALAEAASSTNQYNCPWLVGCTLDAGKEFFAGSSMISARISCLEPPVATNATLLAWLITGYVNVILLGGGLGESSK